MKIDILNKEKEKEKKLLREVTVKIGLKQEDDEDGITVEVLLNSGVTGLVMSLEFARKNKFKKKKLERLIYMRNVNGIFNYKGPIEHMVEVKLFYRGYKEKTKIDITGEQKWSIILGMAQLAYYNPEIDWKIGEVKMTRCPDECGEQQKIKQTKSVWQKQKEKEQKKEKV